MCHHDGKIPEGLSMIYIDKNSKDPWFNIAAEEFALKNTSEDIVMLWVNEPSVVLGKHQNTMAEVNIPYVMEKNIPVIRRISGGGTVYHDLGNLNYSVITTNQNRERLIDFPKFAEPIIQFMKARGHDVHFYGKTNLGVQGLKFSGNAAHVFKNRALHHGTLLFDADLFELEQTIRQTDAHIEDKAVKSVRAEMVNLKSLLPQFDTLADFHLQFKAFLLQFYSISVSRSFAPDEIESIQTLTNEKYRSTEWNYGYSPGYFFKKSAHHKGKNVTLQLEVKKGIIVDLQLQSSVMTESDQLYLQKILINKPHHPQAMIETININEISLKNLGLDNQLILSLLI